MISVIVPVYNVARYIDRCMDTIVNQSYKDIEIILVDNHSERDTLRKEEEWIKRDGRVRRVFQKTPGLGTGRDLGVSEAGGEYIAFVDPDDWWDLSMLEKLYDKITSEQSDICMCDKCDVQFDEAGNVINKCNKIAPAMLESSENIIQNPALITLIEVSANGKLYKKSLFTENNIITPNCAGEDRAVMHFLFYKAKKISRVREYLYYYHAERKGSNVNSYKAYETMPECIDEILKLFIADGAFEKNKALLRFISRMTASIAVTPIKNLPGDICETERMHLLQKIIDKHRYYFPDIVQNQYIVGSYGLRRMVWLAYQEFEEKRTHIGFSSIISLMSEKIELHLEYKKDSLREQWLNMDMSKDFLEKVKPEQGEYFFIDFLEERFDVAFCRGSYFTYSNIFEEIQDSVNLEYTVLNRMDSIVDKIWMEKCDQFIEWLKSKTDAEHIILMKNKLCNRHGVYQGTTLFLDQEKINGINQKLDFYYDYFITNFKGIHVIDTNINETFFTSENFPFGVTPYHVNECYYLNQAHKLREIIL